MTTTSKCLGRDLPSCARCLRYTTPETPGCGWVTPVVGVEGCRLFVEGKEGK